MQRTFRFFVPVFLLAVALCLATPSAVFAAAIFYVSPAGNDGHAGLETAPFLTIQHGINAAGSGDTVLVEDGAYTGPGDVDLDFGGRSITVRSQNGPASTLIDCGASLPDGSFVSHRGFYLHSGETSAVVQGFTIENGYESGDNGGGMLIAGVGVLVRNCVFKNNAARFNFSSGSQTYSGGSGGGVYTDTSNGVGSITLDNCAFIGNQADIGGGGVGNNSGAAGSITLTNCTITGSGCSGGGAGIANTGAGSGPIALINCVITDNTTYQSGFGGGGVSNLGSSPVALTNCTLSANMAGYGGGGGVYDNGSGAVTLTNDIVYGNVGGQIRNDSRATTPAAAAHCDVQGSYPGTGNIDAYPLFVNISSDLRLQPGSPCLGAGAHVGAPATDKDGTMRPNPPSIGAHELSAAAIGVHTHILWNNANGQASLWTITSAGSITAPVYGPFPSWTARAASEGPDGVSHILWNNADGQASVWTISSGGGIAAPVYGPYPGWAAQSLSTSGDGKTHLLWDKTDGTASLWSLDTRSDAFTHTEYGPLAGWTAHAVASGATVTDLLWTNADGSAMGYRIPLSGALTFQTFGPFYGWTANALSVGPDDGAHLLWNNTDGTAGLWDADFSTGSAASVQYGPFSGWSALALATGPDGVSRLLWDNTNGAASLWSAYGSGYAHTEYGPFQGWVAVAVSAGP